MALVFMVFESLQGWDGWGQAGPRASDLLLRHPGGPPARRLRTSGVTLYVEELPVR